MIYLNVRHTVADYEKWRPFFDADESRRRAAGATGVNQVFRDANDPNVVTLVMQWDNVANAQKFANDPMLGEVMQKAGVIGMPAVAAILLPA
jgi:quinol monooxygenase YgiN